MAMLERWPTTSLHGVEGFPTISGGHLAALDCSEHCEERLGVFFIMCPDAGTAVPTASITTARRSARERSA
jgi:hypothetical protein